MDRKQQTKKFLKTLDTALIKELNGFVAEPTYVVMYLYHTSSVAPHGFEMPIYFGRDGQKNLLEMIFFPVTNSIPPPSKVQKS